MGQRDTIQFGLCFLIWILLLILVLLSFADGVFYFSFVDYLKHGIVAS